MQTDRVPVTPKKLEEVRCHACRRLLCKTTAKHPVRVSEMVEIKCGKCDALNYLMPRPE